MFDYKPFIGMVIFVLWLDWDKDEDPRFHLINPSYVELLSIHDCTHNPFYLDGCVHDMDP